VQGYKVLLVEDEPHFRDVVRDFLESNGCEIVLADTCGKAEQCTRLAHPDVAILDYDLPDGNALELLPRLKGIDPGMPLILLTGHGSIDLAVEAIKLGAEQFLTKPAELPALLLMIKRTVENRRNQQKQLAEQKRFDRRDIDPFVGTSAAIRQLAETARKIVVSDTTVLIQAETGAGKGVLARWLHRNGSRAVEAFVDLNCAGLSRELLETELFGHQKGAFTGAVQNKPGLLEIAHRGTVFLDEIGDMDTLIQPKLLKVLEEKHFRRLGDVQDRGVNVRLIAATHRDLASMIRASAFREDLYFRISTIKLSIPPLRERVEDIPLLAADLLESLRVELGMSAIGLAPEATRKLQSYSWPGNIRELRNVLERAILLSGNRTLKDTDFVFDMQLTPPAQGGGVKSLEEMERDHIQSVLSMVGGRVDVAAEKLGIPRSSLYHKLKQYRVAAAAGNTE